jgi:hypothetical protein
MSEYLRILEQYYSRMTKKELIENLLRITEEISEGDEE